MLRLNKASLALAIGISVFMGEASGASIDCHMTTWDKLDNEIKLIPKELPYQGYMSLEHQDRESYIDKAELSQKINIVFDNEKTVMCRQITVMDNDCEIFNTKTDRDKLKKAIGYYAHIQTAIIFYKTDKGFLSLSTANASGEKERVEACWVEK